MRRDCSVHLYFLIKESDYILYEIRWGISYGAVRPQWGVLRTGRFLDEWGENYFPFRGLRSPGRRTINLFKARSKKLN